MPEHVHVHAPHELSEPGEAVSHRERVLELIAALMMSLATLGIAWSGYQAARWSGEQAELYTQASAARSLANRASVFASQERLQDLTNFNRWLELSTTGDTELADLYERRFRDEFRPAFTAWVAQDPLHNPNAIASPLRMPEYQTRGARQVRRARSPRRPEIRRGQGSDRAGRQVRVHHRVLRRGAVLRRDVTAVRRGPDCASWCWCSAVACSSTASSRCSVSRCTDTPTRGQA